MQRRLLKAVPARRSNATDPEQYVTIQLYTIFTLTSLDVHGGGVVGPIIFEFSDDLDLEESHRFLIHKSYLCYEKHEFSLILNHRYSSLLARLQT